MLVNRRFVLGALALVAIVAAWNATRGENDILAQQYSNKCQTSGGICYVASLPIGSACSCGSLPGTIIP